MQGWRRRGLGAAVLAAVCAVGCGQVVDSATGQPPGEDVEATMPLAPQPWPMPPLENTAPRVPPPLTDSSVDPCIEQPRDAPLHADASTLAFEPPACVPLHTPPTGRRFPSACEVRTLRPDGSLARVERFDAQGHLLEEHVFWSTMSSHRVNRWEQGRQVHGTFEASDGEWDRRDWFFDAEGRPVRHVRQTGPRHAWRTEVRTTYDAQGRIARVEEDKAGQAPGRSEFLYGVDGRLASVVSQQELAEGPFTVERYTYHPNGHLATFEATPPPIGGSERREYDAAGRLVRFRHCTHHSCWGEEREYDVHGQLTRTRGQQGGDGFENVWDRLRVYDAHGRQIVELTVSDTWDANGELPRAGQRQVKTPRYIQRQVRRGVYACETEQLLREELDERADGTPDGWRELEYDAAGNLVAERFSGTLASPELGRREYDYSCH